MEAFFESYLDRLEELYREAEAAIEGLPVEALDWSPGPEMNSIAVLLVHLAGSVRYWVGDVAGGEPSGRDREAEFQVRSLGPEVLKKRLDESLQASRDVVQRLSLRDLAVVHPSSVDGDEFTSAWALLHALEHAAIHLGHIQLMRQLWDQQVRPW